MSSKLTAITTVRQGSDKNPVEKTRAEIFLDTATACANLDINLLAVFKDCSESYLKNLENRNVLLVQQQTRGKLGAVRRETMVAGIKRFDDSKYYLWLEPEKPTIPALAKNIISELEHAGAEFCFFNRRSMKSYPPEQAHYYLFCREVASRLVGYDLDYSFGPMIFTKASAPFFIKYHSEYGDLWDSILVPRIRIIRSNLKYAVKKIEFSNHPRMTAIESGNPKMILKRVKQLQNVIPSLIAEWYKWASNDGNIELKDTAINFYENTPKRK